MLLKKLITLHSTFIRHTFRKISSHLLPCACILCGHFTRHAGNLCLDCQHNLPILPYHCPQCAQFLSLNEHPVCRQDETTNHLLCGTCLRHPPPFERTYTLFPYEPPIAQLIIQLKFRHQLSHAKTLGELFIQKIQQFWYKNAPLPDLIIPVPLHPYRLRERGFNQAVEIARPIHKALGIPVDTHGITRIKHTQAQSGLIHKARKQNVANAFTAHRDYSNLTIAVLDDVVTTGHTIAALCEIIKQRHAKRIEIWCVARSAPP